MTVLLGVGCSSDDDTDSAGASPCAGEGLGGLVWPEAGAVIAEDIDGIVGELDRAVEAMLDRTDLQVARGDDGPSGCSFVASAGDDPVAALVVATPASGALELQWVAMPPDNPSTISVSIVGSIVRLHYGRALDCQGVTKLNVTYGNASAEAELNAAGDIELTLPTQPVGPGTIVVRTTDDAGVVVCVSATAVRPGDFAAG